MNALEHPASAVAADLHSHSTVSDGLLTPREVVECAADRGVELFALTDHDEVSGLAEADWTARALRLPFVHGVEVSVTWSGTTVHVVGLGIDPDHRPLKQALARVRSGQKKAQAAKRYFGRANDPNRPAEVRRSAQVLLDEILSRPLEEEPRHAGPVPPSYHHIVDQGWDIYERLKPRYNRWAQEVRRVFKDWDVSAHLRPAWDAIVKTVQQSRIVSTYGRPLTEGGRGLRVAGGKQIRDPWILEEVSVLVNAAVNRAFVEAAKEKRGRSLEVIREITLRILGGKARGVPKSLEEPSFRNFVERTIETL